VPARVRVQLDPEAHGIIWGNCAGKDGAVGEVNGPERRDDGPRIPARLPTDVWHFATGCLYAPYELEPIDDLVG
jgi:hypothetical protein